MIRTWRLWATRSWGTHWHIGAKRWVELHGLSDPIVPVLIEERIGDPRAAEITHYGWTYTDAPDKITMIWPRAREAHVEPWMSPNICFGYGMQVEIDQGNGQMLALCITEIDKPLRE